MPWAACKVGVTTEGCTILAKGLAGSLGRGPEDRMAELITVDRSDGRAVAGLVTSLLVNWDHIPPGVQAAIIRHADAAAFESAGRSDGSYVVTAFVLRHRAALARSARVRTGAGSRGWRAVEMVAAQRRRLGEAATRLRVLRWLASLRKAA